MMKKVSYIFVLFISLFIFENVKADIVCPAQNDMEKGFIFSDASGRLKAIRTLSGEEEEVSDEERIQSSDSRFVVDNVSKCPLYKSDYIESVLKVDDAVRRGRSKYSFTIEYKMRVYPERYIICPVKNDMEVGFVFSSTGNLKAIQTLSGEVEELTDEEQKQSTNSGFVVDDASKCPVSKNDYVEKGQHKYSFPDNYDDENIYGCSDIKIMERCRNNNDFSCVWVDKTTGNVSNKDENGYCNVDNLQYVACGDTFDIPTYLPRIISFFINLLKIATPIILVFTSAISLMKAITANKEDEMEKAKKSLIRKIAIAVLIFFTITITQFVVEKVADDGEIEEFRTCLDCFINNNCDQSKYYKNNINGEYQCFTVDDKTPLDNSKCH